MINLDKDKVAQLRSALRGPLLQAGDAGYDTMRALWNAMTDRRPGLIASCTGTADVLAAVNFARSEQLRLAVKGGGHNIAGNALCDDGLVIDLGGMRSVHVDPEGLAQ